MRTSSANFIRASGHANGVIQLINATGGRDATYRAMSFIAWHNRLTFTPMLEPTEALVVTLMYEQKELDGMFFTALKTMLEEVRSEPILNLEQAKARAEELLTRLNG